MKLKLQFFVVLLMLFPAVASSLQAQSARQLTTTLLPINEEGAIEADDDVNDLLWIQTDPSREILLQFDLGGLPPELEEADFRQCTLRLVAQNVVYQPVDNPNSGGPWVIVEGRLVDDGSNGDDNTGTIIALSPLSEKKPVAMNKETPAHFRKAIYQEYAGDKKISIKLFSESHKASTLFYSVKKFDSAANPDDSPNPSDLPRLVIEYTPRPRALPETLSWPQHQQNPEHTGRSPWKPFKAPISFSLAEIDLPRINGRAATVRDYPLIYRGNIYLLLKALDLNYLLALDYKGNELWRQEVGSGTVQRPPVISRDGIFYAVIEKQISAKQIITAYNLNRSGQTVASRDLPGKLSTFTDLTCGNDGSLFCVMKERGVNYIYGFTPDLKPFLKSGPLGSGEDHISTVTVSPDGRKIFVQYPKGALIVDIADPSKQLAIQLSNNDEKPWEYYHVPLAAPAGGIMVFSDFTETANKGNVWGYTADRRIWSTAGTLTPQPVLGSNDLVYYIQGGAFQGHHYNKHSSAAITSGTQLNATSNLVVDGADNVYFWDNGYLHGYGPDGQPLFDGNPMTSGVKGRNLDENGRKIQGPEQFVRLMLGPDGTLWANNKNGSTLYAFKPQYADVDLTLHQKELQSDTFYRAAGKIAMAEGGITLEADKKILLQAYKGIAFPRGFAVRKGAGLVCRTDF
jgi:hypothetical protein